MGFIIFGTRQAPIDMDEYLVYCRCCEGQAETEVLVFSRYFHLYWIPVFPIAKQATTVCTKCGLRTTERDFDEQLIHNYAEVKRHYRHPWYTYILTLLFILLVAGMIGNG